MRFLPLFFLLIVAACQPTKGTTEQKVDAFKAVDPFIGTAGHGHTFPGATTPFGMVQLSPDNGTEGWDWCSGYNYIDSNIVGFSHTHMSGTGIGDLYDISFMPSQNVSNDTSLATTFDHRNEASKPGYYKVKMDNGVTAELTSSPHVGFHQYTFDSGAKPTVGLDLGFSINWDDPTDTEIRLLSDSMIVGYRKSTGWSKEQLIHFVAVFDQKIEQVTMYQEGEKVEALAKGKDTKAAFHFKEGTTKVKLKVALSTVSAQGAIANMDEEVDHWDFDQLKTENEAAWQKHLAPIKIEGGQVKDQTAFYTALYHVGMSPNLMSDVDGSYRGVDKEIHNKGPRYTILSIWDTFRAFHPFLNLVYPQKAKEILPSLMLFEKESGALPVWAIYGHEAHTMTGYHAVPVLAEAASKGIIDQSPKMLEAMENSSNQNIRGSNYFRKYGYIPGNLDGWSVTKTLEYAYDDYCIAKAMEQAGRKVDAKKYYERAMSYKALFDKELGFMRAKDDKGNWIEPFDSYRSEHGFEGQYIEGTAWQHSWFVPHDVEGLVQLFGSKEAFITKLDSLFTTTSQMTGENVSADISGLIGQYAHGNEPSHHIVYLYNYVGQPYKAQQRVRQIMEELYTDKPDGLCGNEDCGQMSAWYLFSSLGFYPVDPISGEYVIGSPLFSKATIELGNGKQFMVEALDNSAKNIYIKNASLNGQALDKSFITHEQIMAGGKLVLEMSAEPNKELWSTSVAYPSSLTKLQKAQ